VLHHGGEEPTVLIEGWSRGEAIEVGRLFGQRAVFELTEDEVQVVACVDGEVRARRPRSR
jgi:hypothetical protein